MLVVLGYFFDGLHKANPHYLSFFRNESNYGKAAYHRRRNSAAQFALYYSNTCKKNYQNYLTSMTT